MATDQSQALDKILGHLDSLHTKIDGMGKDHEGLAARLDAIEKEREQEKADRVRKDTEEKEKADAAARAASDPALAKRLADIERQASTLTEANRSAFAEVQMRADSAYQAWGKTAPHALHGEKLRDFQIRLLTPLKQHSKRYKDSALDLIGDESVFATVEGAIINDAIEASSDPATIGTGNLREITTRDPSGHMVTKFVGDSAVAWAPFMGGQARFGRINRGMANKSLR